eukprot:14035944-Ditylum_brightwellii.AAC.1
MCVARKLEREKTFETSKSVQYDGNKVDLAGSIDMHWPTRGSGKSYSSDAGASYTIAVLVWLIVVAW